MPHPRPLPPLLPLHFSVTDAIGLGVSRSRLTRGDMRRPFPGVRSTSAEALGGGLIETCRDYAPRLKPWQFFSHETALMLVGAPMPDWPYMPTIHVSAHRPAREPRVADVRGHRLQVRESATTVAAGGLLAEHPVRAWRQAGTLWRLDDLIVAGDFLISGSDPLATTADLSTEIDRMGDMRGGILRKALALVRPSVRSPRETTLRLRLLRAGLPEPEINWILRDHAGRHVAELDLAYPAWQVGIEYDGRVHATDFAQFEKDADRWDRIRAQGWQHVRVLNHHLRGSGDPAVRKVRQALMLAGWRPGR